MDRCKEQGDRLLALLNSFGGDKREHLGEDDNPLLNLEVLAERTCYSKGTTAKHIRAELESMLRRNRDNLAARRER